MRRLAFLLFPLAIGCQAPAAGEGDDEGDGGGLPESEWVSQYSAMRCELAHVECDCSDPYLPSQDVCLDLNTQVVEMWGNQARAAGLVYDGNCAAEVLAWLEQSGCDTYSELEYAECVVCSSPGGVYHGNVGEGAACAMHGLYSDCASGLSCLFGTCVDSCADDYEPPSIGEGELCTDVNSYPLGLCEAPLLCNTDTHVCVSVPAIGEACPDGYCQDGAYCPGTGFCVESPADGEPCPGGVCASYGSVCRAQDGGPEICVAEALICN